MCLSRVNSAEQVLLISWVDIQNLRVIALAAHTVGQIARVIWERVFYLGVSAPEMYTDGEIRCNNRRDRTALQLNGREGRFRKGTASIADKGD